MSERDKTNSRWVVVGAVLAFIAGLGVGHFLVAQVPVVETAAVAPAPAPAPASAKTALPAAARSAASANSAAAATGAADGVQRFQVPVTASQPSLGPMDAIVTIVEWCDLESPACSEAHSLLTAVIERYGAQVRVVFRHFAQPSPELMPRHEFARIAHAQGKFWEARALLARAEQPTTRADLERYAGQLGLDGSSARRALDQHDHAGYVAADRLFAQMFGVDEIPALFVNGRRLAGEPNAPALHALIDDEIARANELVQRGVPKAQVYAELTARGTWQQVASRKN